MKKIFSVALVLAALLVSMSFVSCSGNVEDGTYTLSDMQVNGESGGSLAVALWNAMGYGTLVVEGENITIMGATFPKSYWVEAGTTFKAKGNKVIVTMTDDDGEEVKLIYTK